ncbi:alpha/beta fold hydrolase [Nocardia pseudovaccinii]|uniref:alpha/beta fold hydrolase n=1 Tax=Nocardia pseudovaccinii TaxID=189540 RepID=UPI0007A48658|nr:alpha/beta hydrolase [Nocardia pseudovaccinii]
MKVVELPAGPIEYVESGEGAPVVFLHGAMKDAAVWDRVVAQLPTGFRYIRPTLPLGSHRLPMRQDADLTVRGLAALVADFCATLDLDRVTLVQNHWGAAQVMLAEGYGTRLRAIVACACEAFDNYPPGAAGRAFSRAARVPGAFAAMGWVTRRAAVRRMLAGNDVTSLRPIPAELSERWQLPFATEAEVRRDVRKILSDDYSRDQLERWAAAVAGFDGPALVVWAVGDKLMPRDHGARLAAAFGNGELVEIADSATCIPLDQPQWLATEIARFLAAH